MVCTLVMEETPSYVIPSDSEKLSHKFILDARA